MWHETFNWDPLFFPIFAGNALKRQYDFHCFINESLLYGIKWGNGSRFLWLIRLVKCHVRSTLSWMSSIWTFRLWFLIYSAFFPACVAQNLEKKGEVKAELKLRDLRQMIIGSFQERRCRRPPSSGHSATLQRQQRLEARGSCWTEENQLTSAPEGPQTTTGIKSSFRQDRGRTHLKNKNNNMVYLEGNQNLSQS